MTDPSPLARWVTEPLRRLHTPLAAIYKVKALNAYLWPPWVSRRELADGFDALWTYVLSATDSTTEALTRLGNTMTSNEDAAYARAGELVALIKAEFASLRAQLDEASQGTDAAVASALNEDSAADAERVGGLISELESVLPAQVPEVPVPDPGQAAELPADGGDTPTDAA